MAHGGSTAAAVQGYDFDSTILAHTLNVPEDRGGGRLERLEREHEGFDQKAVIESRALLDELGDAAPA